MSVEIRAITDKELEEFTNVAATALGVRAETPWNFPPEHTLCAFEDGKITTTYAAWPYTMYFNGKDAPVAGVAAVGTLPVYRRRGYLRQITAAHFQRMYEEGERSIAILWPSQAAIYRRYGYAMVTTQYTWQIQPCGLQFANPEQVTGTFQVVADDELELLEQIYGEFCMDRTGCIHRDRERWQRGVLAPQKQGVFSKVIYQEDNKPLGYVLYIIESTGPGYPNQQLTIRDFAWLTHTAHQAIWQYLAGLDLISSITWRCIPSDYLLPHLLLEPRAPSILSIGGVMGRIVDVSRALTQRNYPMEGRLTFEIRDESCPWNEGCWELETSGGESSVQRTDASPQVVMPIHTLALLAFGRIGATEAARVKLLDALEPQALPIWDMVMHTTFQPICMDYF